MAYFANREGGSTDQRNISPIGGGLVAYRKSWLAEVGYDGKFPATWDECRTAGQKLKKAGRPYGQAAGHTFGDAPGWWYPYLWSWGGKESKPTVKRLCSTAGNS